MNSVAPRFDGDGISRGKVSLVETIAPLGAFDFAIVLAG